MACTTCWPTIFLIGFFLTSQFGNARPNAFSEVQRTNFCGRLNGVLNGSIPFVQALDGATISAIVDSSTPPFLMTFDEDGFPSGGFFFQILQILQKTGNFKMLYLPAPKTNATNSITEKLQFFFASTSADVAVTSLFSDTPDRREREIGFLQPLGDMSPVLVTRLKKVGNPNNFWGFADPFDKYVWMSIILVILATGILHYLISDDSTVVDFQDWQRKAFFNVYLSFAQFAGGAEGLSASSYGTAILLCGFSFLMLILGASYTANLASFLVNDSQTNPVLESIDKAVATNAKVCTLPNSVSSQQLSALFPTFKTTTVGLSNTDWISLLSNVADGTCQGAIVPEAYFQAYSGKAAANPFCNMLEVGQHLMAVFGSWPYPEDYSLHCTSFAMDVLSMYISSLRQSGELDNLWKQTLNFNTDLTCSPDSTPQSNDQLTMENMTGIFVVYGICFGSAVFLHFSHSWALHFYNKFRAENTPEPKDDIVLQKGITPELPETFTSNKMDEETKGLC